MTFKTGEGKEKDGITITYTLDLTPFTHDPPALSSMAGGGWCTVACAPHLGLIAQLYVQLG